jgi:Asp-tRNA(Asn)/Glu-tRNA(Gln) amidotransferase A subunit family amidase
VNVWIISNNPFSPGVKNYVCNLMGRSCGAEAVDRVSIEAQNPGSRSGRHAAPPLLGQQSHGGAKPTSTYVVFCRRAERVLGLGMVAMFSALTVSPIQAQTSPVPQMGPIESHVRALAARFDLVEPSRKAWISSDWRAAVRIAQELDGASNSKVGPSAGVISPTQPIQLTQTAQSIQPIQPTQSAPVLSALKDSAQKGAPLFGLVLAVKDNIDVAGFATTAGSRSLSLNRPASDATVVGRLRSRGVIFAGKTNLDTFARGVRSRSEVRGQTANAWDVNRAAGGSSGGSAVAVASDMADAALGTDTCGSLRYPATYNGIYSLRPTWGLLSRHGVVPLAPSQDTVGPMARTPTILRSLFEAMLGEDPLDPVTQVSARVAGVVPPTERSAVPRTYRIGVFKSLGAFATDGRGRSMLDVLAGAGMELVTVSLPKEVSNASLIDAEADQAIRQFRTWSQEHSNETSDSAPWLVLSTKPVRTRWNGLKTQQRKNAQFITELLDGQRLDALAYPTTPFVAASLGGPQPSANCWLSATSGLPALAVPGGFNAHGFPAVGIDLLGRAFQEPTLLEVAQLVHAAR